MALNTGFNFQDLWNEINRTYKSPTEKFFDKYSEEVEFEVVADTPKYENALDDMDVESLDYDTMSFCAYINLELKTIGKETIDITPKDTVQDPESNEEEWVPLKTKYNKILINRKV